MRPALASLSIVPLLLSGAAMPAEPPIGTRFLGRGGDGWFWYETLPARKPPPAPAAPSPPAGGSAAAPPRDPAPLSAAWFRQELERYRDQAIDEPTASNVRAYLYLQKVMLDKADAFAQASRRVAAVDPYLDATTERPLAPFAAHAANAEAGARRTGLLREIAGRAGLLLIVDSRCAVCARQAEVLRSAQRLRGWALLVVSLDGRAPPDLALPVRADAGQARLLGVVATPALFLMRPPDTILTLAQGALDLDTLSERILLQAHEAGWIDDAAYAATRPVRQPFAVPEAAGLDAVALADPALLVAALRERLGVPDPAPETPALAPDRPALREPGALP